MCATSGTFTANHPKKSPMETCQFYCRHIILLLELKIAFHRSAGIRPCLDLWVTEPEWLCLYALGGCRRQQPHSQSLFTGTAMEGRRVRKRPARFGEWEYNYSPKLSRTKPVSALEERTTIASKRSIGGHISIN